MVILSFLESAKGIALLHFTQTIVFGFMVYIIGAEYLRTRRDDLIYKLVASSSITLINMATTVIVILQIFYNITISQKYFPVIFNSLFAIIVLSLARAFVYDYVSNKKKFETFIKTSMMSVVVVYIIMQAFWSVTFKPDMVFGKSGLQLLFSLFFIVVLIFSIFYIIKFRRSYRVRLVIAFVSIIVVQLVTIYDITVEKIPDFMLLVRSASPILVPIMFTSVVFKELIESVVTMVEHLQHSLEHQRDLIFEVTKVGSDLSNLSDDLVKMSIDGWQKLSFVVDNIQSQEVVNDEIMNLTGSTINSIDDMTHKMAKRSGNMNDVLVVEGDMELRPDAEQQRMIDIVEDISGSIDAAFSVITESNKALSGLVRSGDEIAASLKEIEDVADKTAMLSINASIEAARALEFGRGFSIVAHEITKLADKSQKHTEIVNNIIRDIIKGVKSTNKKISTIIKDMERTIKEVKGIYSFLTDAIHATKMFEAIIAQNEEVNNSVDAYGAKIKGEMTHAEEIMIKSKQYGQGIKNAIRKHITDIESIAGLSDKLKELVKNMNIKTNKSIEMAERLQNFVK